MRTACVTQEVHTQFPRISSLLQNSCKRQNINQLNTVIAWEPFILSKDSCKGRTVEGTSRLWHAWYTSEGLERRQDRKFEIFLSQNTPKTPQNTGGIILSCATNQGVESFKFSTLWNEERLLLTVFIETMKYKWNMFVKILIKLSHH